MKKAIFSLALLFAFVGALQAGSLTNKDQQIQYVSADYGHGIVIKFKMRPNYTYKYVCAHCTITVGSSQVEVTETDNAIIQGGKVSVPEE